MLRFCSAANLFDTEAWHSEYHGGIVANVIRSDPATEDGRLFRGQGQLSTFIPADYSKLYGVFFHSDLATKKKNNNNKIK